MTEEINEQGQRISISCTGAKKEVKDERYSLIPAGALKELALVYGLGAKKYEDHNWRKGYEWSKSIDSLLRHFEAFRDGEDFDPELGTPHLANVAWHAFTLLTFMKEHPELDDRYKKKVETVGKVYLSGAPSINTTVGFANWQEPIQPGDRVISNCDIPPNPFFSGARHVKKGEGGTVKAIYNGKAQVDWDNCIGRNLIEFEYLDKAV